MSQAESRPLKLLLDQGIPADAAILFRELGYECQHVSEIGMQRAADEDILTVAKSADCVVITLDTDFHMLIAIGGLSGPSVVRIRREGCPAEKVVENLASVLSRHSEDLAAGALRNPIAEGPSFQRFRSGLNRLGSAHQSHRLQLLGVFLGIEQPVKPGISR